MTVREKDLVGYVDEVLQGSMWSWVDVSGRRWAPRVIGPHALCRTYHTQYMVQLPSTYCVYQASTSRGGMVGGIECA